jgi:hypothetical protein
MDAREDLYSEDEWEKNELTKSDNDRGGSKKQRGENEKDRDGD